ncbi:TlpA family protein disulfide reductase [bacterium]|nr:TlpA family protein disulfide reductase [bacterium]
MTLPKTSARLAAAIALLALVCAASAYALSEGGAAPAFTLTDADGKPMSLSDHKGRVVLMSFWATWCLPCLKEMPTLEEIYKEFEGRGFTVLSINTDASSGAARARQLVKRKKVTYPVLYDANSKVVGLYNPKGDLPFTVLIDREGKVAFTHTGFDAGFRETLEARIRAALDAAN